MQGAGIVPCHTSCRVQSHCFVTHHLATTELSVYHADTNATLSGQTQWGQEQQIIRETYS